MENPVEQRRGQNYFFFQIMEFSGLTQPSNIISSNAGLTGESKSKIKPDKFYYHASIHSSQTVLRLPSSKKCWSS